MSDPDRQALITEFKEITGVADDRAKFYLESTNWTLQVQLKIEKCIQMPN